VSIYCTTLLKKRNKQNIVKVVIYMSSTYSPVDCSLPLSGVVSERDEGMRGGKGIHNNIRRVNRKERDC
jgi:hypothetical protein